MSVDELEKSRELITRLQLTFPLGSDVSRELTRAFGVYDPGNDIAWPAIYLVGPDGTLRWRSLSETYTQRPAAQVVLEAFDALR